MFDILRPSLKNVTCTFKNKVLRWRSRGRYNWRASFKGKKVIERLQGETKHVNKALNLDNMYLRNICNYPSGVAAGEAVAKLALVGLFVSEAEIECLVRKICDRG